MNNVIVAKENVKEKDKVVKGKHWKWEDQGGYSRYGVIKYIINDDWVSVKWENGEMNFYRIGAEGYYDLYFYTEHLTPSLINRIGHLL